MIIMPLDNSSHTFINCFYGDNTYDVCSTCGFCDFEGNSQGTYDCVTCQEGYEIDVS